MKKLLIITTVLGFAAAVSALAADANENWSKTCIKCHGAEGKGDTKIGEKLAIKDLTDAKVQAGFTDEQALKALVRAAVSLNESKAKK